LTHTQSKKNQCQVEQKAHSELRFIMKTRGGRVGSLKKFSPKEPEYSIRAQREVTIFA